MAKSDSYLAALKQAGRRITEQRRIICDYLAETRMHPSAYQVYAELAARHPDISRATVYNTLNALQELGAIVEIGYGDGHTHYETDTSPHVNLVCLRCHAIEDYPAPAGTGQLAGEVASTGFQTVAVKVEVFGFCAKCCERKKAEIRAQWAAQHPVVQKQSYQQPAARGGGGRA